VSHLPSLDAVGQHRSSNPPLEYANASEAPMKKPTTAFTPEKRERLRLLIEEKAIRVGEFRLSSRRSWWHALATWLRRGR